MGVMGGGGAPQRGGTMSVGNYQDPNQYLEQEQNYLGDERASRERIAGVGRQGSNEFNVPGRSGASMTPLGWGLQGLSSISEMKKQEERVANEPAMAQLKFQQDKFGQLFPWLQGQLGNLSSQFATAGGASGQGPTINAAPVWNPQQIQQQVNTTRAQNDASAASQAKSQASAAGAQGFGTSSPLLAALMGQTQAANLATNTGAEQSLRNTAAQTNAQQVLGAQTARENQFASRQREDIERRKPIYGLYGQLLSSIAGL